MKRISKKQQEACDQRYEECVDLQICNVCCSGVKNHPECATDFYCRHDRKRCDGCCELHRLRSELKSKMDSLHSLGEAKRSIEAIIRKTQEEYVRLNKQYEELSRD